VREEAKRWWSQGLEDLKATELNLGSRLFYVCAFFSQQAAEKALKALYIEVKREPQPRTHDLTELGTSLQVPADIMDILIELNPVFVVTRYPDAANGIPARMYNERLASSHLDQARRVIEWARERLQTK
jgi:HEPN domain-containing protein